jgi:hypothetical protein
MVESGVKHHKPKPRNVEEFYEYLPVIIILYTVWWRMKNKSKVPKLKFLDLIKSLKLIVCLYVPM